MAMCLVSGSELLVEGLLGRREDSRPGRYVETFQRIVKWFALLKHRSYFLCPLSDAADTAVGSRIDLLIWLRRTK
jgi:hypothetical protein